MSLPSRSISPGKGRQPRTCHQIQPKLKYKVTYILQAPCWKPPELSLNLKKKTASFRASCFSSDINDDHPKAKKKKSVFCSDSKRSPRRRAPIEASGQESREWEVRGVLRVRPGGSQASPHGRQPAVFLLGFMLGGKPDITHLCQANGSW